MTAWIATAVVLSPSPQTPVWKRGFERNVRTQMSYGWCTSWYVSSACTVPCGVSTGYTSRLQRMLLVTRHRGFQFSFVSNFVLNNTQIYKTGKMDIENSAEEVCVCVSKILFSLLLKTLQIF